jgi:hypothetical protein
MGERIDRVKTKLVRDMDYWNQVADASLPHADTQIYEGENGWNVRHIIVHVADSDRGISRQIQGFTRGETIVPPDFDLERYNRRVVEKLGAVSIDEARANLAQQRQDFLTWLDTQDDAILDLPARHPGVGELPLGKMILTLGVHQRQHGTDIVQKLNLSVDA